MVASAMRADADLRPFAAGARSWPFREARRLAERLAGHVPAKGHALFQTGYGPSGLPHIGTFGEVARTAMVRRAFGLLTGMPTRLVAFSDDMDGMRSVPDNIPAPERLTPYLGRPLSSVPDPFGTHESFAAHNNARLRAFLDDCGFDYEFLSATECYRSGRFDAMLLRLLERFDAVCEVILPTLGPERRATYSPFLPVCPRTGAVLQVPALERRPDDGTIVYRDPETGARVEVPVTGGGCKLQWKADWAMRWAALDVDYEMAGKDLIDSVRLSGRICTLLGGRPPAGFIFEMFLDAGGEKISKSRGNGLSMEEWLRYGPAESLSLFMFGRPAAAKKLHFGVIPRSVDDYLGHLERYAAQEPSARLDNPVWHIHGGDPPPAAPPVGFGLLLNLASVCNTQDPAVLWGFISRTVPDAVPGRSPLLDRLVGHALNCYRDLIAPHKRYRPPDAVERAALEDLDAALAALPAEAGAGAIQGEIYAVGNRHDFGTLRDWFRALYEVLCGQSEGPRFGSFVALYGIAETRGLIRRALAGEDLGRGAV